MQSPPAAINRLLVANRGEIARRVFRTCRRLGISTVAVYSDADAGELFVEEADVGVALGGAAAAESYLRGEAIIAAARRTGADAVHPGYGFLAENAAFAQAVLDAGLSWVGPSPAAIAAMGSKIEARTRMQAAGVPVLPGVHLDDQQGDSLLSAAEAVGYPLLVKASAGGGGKGIRLVEDSSRLSDAVAAARREAAGAFGDETVFLERYAARSRHVEIQILGDGSGRVVSLHERDCSVQRRHQKVIEESPSPAVGEELRARIAAAAVAAGEALGYVGAGTVEFLLTDGDGSGSEFFFLEVNTRLQVEHPVTEFVTGVDLVELQLHLAEGGAVPDPPPLDGHAIEARLCAEDPAHDFLPVTGTLTRFAVPDGVRVDGAVADGSAITPYYDPMIAKVIAHGPNRTAAARKLADALARAELHGLTTNRDFLVRMLRHEEFLAGEADTAFLERQDQAELAEPLLDRNGQRLAAAAAALARQSDRRRGARVLGTLPSGWRNVASEPQRTMFKLPDGQELAVAYRFDRMSRLALLSIDGEELEAPEVADCTPELVDLAVGGVRRRHRIHLDRDQIHVNTEEGQVTLLELPRHPRPAEMARPGAVTAPMPGAVVSLLAKPGDEISAGQPLLVIEAMKMEHELVAPGDGRLEELHVDEGDQVEAGTVLVVLKSEA